VWLLVMPNEDGQGGLVMWQEVNEVMSGPKLVCGGCFCTHVCKKLCQEPIYSAISKCVELIYAFVYELCPVLSRNLCVQLVQTIIKIRAITGTRANRDYQKMVISQS
jgi:hypothetical protein